MLKHTNGLSLQGPEEQPARHDKAGRSIDLSIYALPVNYIPILMEIFVGTVITRDVYVFGEGSL